MLVTVYIKYQNRFLLIRRSSKVLAHKGLWETISFNTEDATQESIKEDIADSIGIDAADIHAIRKPGLIENAPLEKKLYIAEITTPSIQPGWEYDGYEWINAKEAKGKDTVPGIIEELELIKHL